tara:strand:- start:1118 stop:1381 length:264 start_codon:yes stop_codon:yes gene_type:complete
MRHEDSKSEMVRRLASQYGTNHSTKYFVDKCKALGEEVSPNLAHAVLGPRKYRPIQDNELVKRAARELVFQCDGDKSMAIRTLKIHA